MAGPTIKEVLLRFGIDTNSWKSAILELGKLLEQQQKSAALAQENAKKALAEQKAAIQELVAGRKREVEEIQKQAALQKLAGATEAAKAAAHKALAAEGQIQLAQQKLQQELQKTIQAEVQARLQGERLATAEIQKQTAELRRQLAERSIRSATAAPPVGPIGGSSAALQTATQLRIALGTREATELSVVAAERKKIVALADQEIAALRVKGALSAQEQSQLLRLVGLREQQTRLLETGKLASDSQIATAELNLRLAQGEVLSEKELQAEHLKIVALLDQELLALKGQGLQTAEQVAQVRRLTAERAAQAKMAVAPQATVSVAGASPALAAATGLRISMGVQEITDLSAVAAERQKIVALADQEIVALRTKGSLTAQEQSQLLRLVSLREQQVRLLERESLAGKAASASQQAITQLNLRLAQGEVLSKKQLAAEHQKIVSLLDQEIAALRAQGIENAKQVSQVRRLTAERANQSRMAEGGASGVKGFAEQFATGFTSRMMGTLTFAVFTAEGLGRILESLTMKMKEFIESTGPLTQVREQFEKLASTAGLEPVKFIDDLRSATHGLVDDTLLYRNANLLLQSGVKVNRDQIIQLTQATVALARAQGKDASQAIESLNRFFLTGYARSLAWTTGVNASQLQMRGLARAGDQAASATLRLQQATEVLTAQWHAIGEPALTYTERLKQLEVAQHRFGEELALSIQKSGGFQFLLDFLDKAVQEINEWTEKAIGFGETIGEGFAAATEALKGFWQGLNTTAELFKTLVETVVKLAIPDVFSADSISSEFINRLTTIAGLFNTIAQFITLWSGAMTELGLRTIYTLKEMEVSGREFEHWLITGVSHVKEAEQEQHRLHLEFLARMEEAGAQEKKDLVALQDLYEGKKGSEQYKIVVAAPAQLQTDVQEMEHEKQMAKVREQLAIQTAKFQLEQTQTRIKREQDLLQEQYDRGLIQIKDYLAQKKRLENEDFAARVENSNKEYAAKLAFASKDNELVALTARLKKEQANQDYETHKASRDKQYEDDIRSLAKEVEAGTMTPAQAKITGKDLEAQYQAQTTRIESIRTITLKIADEEMSQYYAKQALDAKQHAQELEKIDQERIAKSHALTEEELHDLEAAHKSYESATLQVEKGRIAERKILLEDELKGGNVSAQSYLDSRIGIVRDEFRAEKAEADLQYQYSKKSETDLATYKKQMADAATKQQKELTDLSIHEDEIRVKATESMYDRSQKILEGQLKFHQQAEPFEGIIASQEKQIPILQTLIALEQQRIKAQQAFLDDTDKYNKATGTLNEKWVNVYLSQQKSVDSLQGYIEKLTAAQFSVKLMTGSFQEFSQGFSAVAETFSGKTATWIQNIGQQFSVMSKRAEELSKTAIALHEWNIGRIQKQQGAQAAKKELTPQEIMAATATSVKDSGEGLKDALASSHKEVELWNTALKTSTTEIETEIGRLVPSLGTLTSSVLDAAGKISGAMPRGRTPVSEVAAGTVNRGTLPTSPTTSAQSLSELPKMQKGGPVKRTGPVVVHEGEHVLTKEEVDFYKKILEKYHLPLDTDLQTFIKAGHWEGKEFVPAIAARQTPKGMAPYQKPETEEHKWLRKLLPSFQEGGSPAKTGPAFLHAGETVLPANLSSIFREFITALSSFSRTLTSFKPSFLTATPTGSSVSPFASKAVVAAALKPAVPESTMDVVTAQKSVLAASLPKPGALLLPTDEFLASLQKMNEGLLSTVDPLLKFVESIKQVVPAAPKVTSGLQDLESGFKGFGDIFSKDKEKSGKAVEGFSKSINETMQLVGSVGSVLSGKGGVAASAIGGAQAGSQIGGMLPIPGGAIIGAAIGGIVGIFTGAARAKTDELAKHISATFNAVMSGIQAGTVTLGSGISLQLQAIQNAISTLSGRKGGRDDLNAILPNMEQQLAQLQQQQQQILKNFDQQLTILNAPEAYQQVLGSVDQIIAKYRQYVDAGGSITNANEFLQRSFQNLVTSGLNDLNQSEQDAINNALQYNDLLLQRQDLINNTAMQIQQIMSGGVAQRQMPQWMAKASQLQQLQQQSAQQLAKLDEEIAVSKHKLDAEQQIFNLATTRVGLESQLVVLQNAQTDKDMQRIRALAQLVTAFQGAVPTTMLSALEQLGLGQAYTPWTGDPASRPTPPVKTGNDVVDAQNQAEYQQALAYWNAQNSMPVSYLPTTSPSAPGGSSSTVGGTYTGPAAPIVTASDCGPRPKRSDYDTAQDYRDDLATWTDCMNKVKASSAPPTSAGGTTGANATTVAAPPVSGSAPIAGSSGMGVTLGGTPYPNPTGQLPLGTPTPTINTGTPTGVVLAPSPTTGRTAAASSSLAASTTAIVGAQQAVLASQLQVSNQNLDVEKQITDMVNARVQSETVLVNLKMVEIQADMKRLQAWQDLYGKTSSGANVTLEDLMQKIYQNRGRQGFSGFYGEGANPI